MNDWDVNEYWYFFSDPTHGKARKIVDRLDLDWLDDIESLYYSPEVSFFTKEMIQELSGWTEDEVRIEREKQAAYDEKVREEKAKRREEEKQKNEAKKSDRGRSSDSLDEEEEYEEDETVPGDAEEADNAPSDEE